MRCRSSASPPRPAVRPRCCSVPRGRGCPAARSRPPTQGSSSPCDGVSTRSMWPPPRRSRSGSSPGTNVQVMTDERRPTGLAQVPAHDDLLSRHRAVMPAWMPLYYDEPIEIVSGSGRRVTDAAGRTYLDFFGGVLTTMLGYDLPELRAALDRQPSTGVLHTSTLYLIRSPLDLADKI